MQRWIPMLAAVLGVQLLIAGILVMRGNGLATRPPSAPLLSTPLGAADRILIEGHAAAGQPEPRLELVRHGTAWVVHSDHDVPVAPAKVADLLRRLAGLRRGLAVADTADAQRRFKVAGRRFSRRLSFSHAGKTIATLYLGKSAGLHKADARVAGKHAIYTVDLASYDVPLVASSWIDTQMLQIPSDQIAAIDASGARGPAVHLTRTVAANKAPGPWSATGLPRGRTLDQSKVAALTRAIDELRVDAVLGRNVNPNWQADHPQLTLAIRNIAGKTATWELSRPKNGDFLVLKSSTQPWYFSLTTTAAQPLLAAGVPDGLVAANPGKTHAKMIGIKKIPLK